MRQAAERKSCFAEPWPSSQAHIDAIHSQSLVLRQTLKWG
jgi:hypothetical protein